MTVIIEQRLRNFNGTATTGGGGGGGGETTTPPTASLTGTITDTTLAPVAGATVRVNNGAAFTTNAAGRYTITGLPGSTSLNLAYAGPNAEFFPAGATVTLTGGKTTVLDLFLTRATGQTVNAAGGNITSQVYLDGPVFASYNLVGNELLSGAFTYAGTATAYLAPVDVGKPGHGLASFQASLGAFFPSLAMNTAILETYGSAGLNITDGAGGPLTLVATTSSTGAFALPAKTGGDFSLNFVIAANGAQWPYQQTITNLGAVNAGRGDITLPFAPPVAGAAATATITIDSLATNPNPGQLGYLLAAGRQISSKEDTLAVEQIADVVFQASAASPYGIVTLTPSQNGGGVQLVADTTFAALTTAPGGTYYTYLNTPAEYTIKDLNNATLLPVLVAVKTAQGHYAKISIDAVTAIPSLTTGWQVTFRHAFSLTGTF